MAFQQRTGKTIHASGFRELALFAGAGGGILGGLLLGWSTVCAVELNSFCARRLMQRQNEGHLPPFPIWDDVRTFRGREWRGVVDVVSGGFPCQDISAAQPNGKGLEGSRSGLWWSFARIINEVKPQFVFVENSAMLVNKGLDKILTSLSLLGYSCEWGVLGACHAGAPHERKRIYLLAHSNSERPPSQWNSGPPGKTSTNAVGPSTWWKAEPKLDRVAYGLADRNDRIIAVGNGQVPAVAKTAWSLLYQRMFGREEETC